MPIQLNEEDGDKLLNVHVSGKLTSADYEHFVPEFERLVSQHSRRPAGSKGATCLIWEDVKT